MIEMTWSTPAHTPAATLTYMERLLVHALRQWAADKALWPDVTLEFNRACGPRAATLICESLETMFRNIGLNARRRLRLHQPTCSLVSPDELCVLNLIAARQNCDADHARALADWLLPREAAATLEPFVEATARQLGETGYLLVVRRNSTETGQPADMPRLLAIQ